MINIEATKQHNENNMSLIRRFTKRVRGSGILNRVRGLRYHTREMSQYARKTFRLKSIKRKEEVMDLIKHGRMPETPVRGGRRR